MKSGAIVVAVCAMALLLGGQAPFNNFPPGVFFGRGALDGTASPPTGCTNQLVLAFSNSCALIGQAWGQ